MEQSSESNRNLEIEKYGLQLYHKDAVREKILKKSRMGVLGFQICWDDVGAGGCENNSGLGDRCSFCPSSSSFFLLPSSLPSPPPPSSFFNYMLFLLELFLTSLDPSCLLLK